MMIVRAWTSWIRFLFGPESILPLVMLRIATGALTLIWSVMLYADLDPLLTYLRVEPDQGILWWQFLPNLSMVGVRVLCASLIVMSSMLTIGAWSRLSAWAVFFLTLVLQRYNPAAFNGGDLILRSVLQLGVALGPAGGYLSVDAARKKVAIKPIPQIEAWPLRFVQLHISIGYLLTFYLKTRGHGSLVRPQPRRPDEIQRSGPAHPASTGNHPHLACRGGGGIGRSWSVVASYAGSGASGGRCPTRRDCSRSPNRIFLLGHDCVLPGLHSWFDHRSLLESIPTGWRGRRPAIS